MAEQTNEGDIQGLIFDCDGTLADTMPLHFHAWRSTLDRYGIALDEDRFYSLGGQPTVKIVELLAGEQGLELDAVNVAKEKEEAFLIRLDEVKPITPIVDIVRANEGKLPMAVASGSHRAVVFDVLKIIGLDDLFDEHTVVGAEDTELHKPNPDVFLEAARRIGVDPEKCRVYEDAELGIEAAGRANMACFDVRDVFTPARVT